MSKNILTDPTVASAVKSIRDQLVQVGKYTGGLKYGLKAMLNHMIQTEQTIYNTIWPIAFDMMIIRHYHYAHVEGHGCCHDYDFQGPFDFPFCVFFDQTWHRRKCYLKPPLNYNDIIDGIIVALGAEKVQGVDLDGNGYVYGIDFIINPTDTLQPNGLKQVTLSVDNYLQKTMMSWKEYLATLNFETFWKKFDYNS